MSVDLVTDEGLNVLLQHHHEQLPPETLALIESLSHELRAAVRSDPHIWLKASENRMADCSRAATCKLLHRTVRSLGPTLSEAARTRCLSLFGGTLGFGESGQALFEGGLDLMRAADTPELVKLLDGRSDQGNVEEAFANWGPAVGDICTCTSTQPRPATAAAHNSNDSEPDSAPHQNR